MDRHKLREEGKGDHIRQRDQHLQMILEKQDHSIFKDPKSPMCQQKEKERRMDMTGESDRKIVIYTIRMISVSLSFYSGVFSFMLSSFQLLSYCTGPIISKTVLHIDIW